MFDISIPDIDLSPVLEGSFELIKFGIRLLYELLRHVFIFPNFSMLELLLAIFFIGVLINCFFVPVFSGLGDDEED